MSWACLRALLKLRGDHASQGSGRSSRVQPPQVRAEQGAAMEEPRRDVEEAGSDEAPRRCQAQVLDSTRLSPGATPGGAPEGNRERQVRSMSDLHAAGPVGLGSLPRDWADEGMDLRRLQQDARVLEGQHRDAQTGSGVSRASGGVKFDAEKRERWSLLPTRAVRSIVLVLDYGAKKYAPDNWRKVDNARERYYSAFMRHATAWWEGEVIDPESGLPHLASAACCLIFLLELEGKS